MCGLPPFVDELIDVFIDEETVFVGVPRLFTRPLRLTAPEGFALLAAGRAAMQLPGADPDSPLGRGLAKLAAALGEEPDSDRRSSVDLRRRRSGRRVRRRDQTRRAAADPLLDSVARRGDGTGDHPPPRVPRARRLVRRRPTIIAPESAARSASTGSSAASGPGVFGDPLDDPPDGRRCRDGSVAWSVDGSLPRVTLRLQPAARWVIEQYPVDSVVRADAAASSTRTFAVTSERWLERLLCGPGPTPRCVEPAEYASLGRGRCDSGSSPATRERQRRSTAGGVAGSTARRAATTR